MNLNDLLNKAVKEKVLKAHNNWDVATAGGDLNESIKSIIEGTLQQCSYSGFVLDEPVEAITMTVVDGIVEFLSRAVSPEMFEKFKMNILFKESKHAETMAEIFQNGFNHVEELLKNFDDVEKMKEAENNEN